MTIKGKRLSAKFCTSVREAGDYLDINGPAKGLIFVVGAAGKSKSWLLRYRFRGRRREMGLGSYPEIGLAEARDKGGDARRLLAKGIDPIEHRRQQRFETTPNATFKEMALDWAEHRGRKGPVDDRYRPSTHYAHLRQINKYLAPLHDWPVAKITANDAFELVFKEMMENIPSEYKTTRWLTEAVFEWARARNQFPKNELNPAALKGPFGVLVAGFTHHKKSLPALHYSKVPPFIAAVRRMRNRDYYTCREAARASHYSTDTIYQAIYDGYLKATKSLLPFPTSRRHWQIKHADLVAWVTAEALKHRKPPQIIELLPPPQTINSYVLEFATLTATRPSETRCMQWSEYDPDTQLWIIPWQRHKEGRKTRRDHIIPLAPPAIENLEFLRQRQERDGIKSEFVFGHFININTMAKPGSPPSGEGVRTLLRNLLKQEFGNVDLDKTLHGMRTAFSSWANSTHHYEPMVIERCINHIAGYGKTEVERIYNRDQPFVRDMIPVFNEWARFCNGDFKPADVLPFRQKEKKRATGG
jgi:integrase